MLQLSEYVFEWRCDAFVSAVTHTLTSRIDPNILLPTHATMTPEGRGTDGVLFSWVVFFFLNMFEMH